MQRTSARHNLPLLAALAVCWWGCARKPTKPEHEASSAPSATAVASELTASSDARPLASNDAPSSSSSAATPEANSGPDIKRYAWFQTEAGRALKVDGSVKSRIAPPPGYARVALAPGSFGEWLRGLPLQPAGTDVVHFDGSLSHAADDDYVAAVLAIDIGSVDLQQSADVLIRLNAEWLWSRGDKAAISYPGANKLMLPLARWEKGQRIISEGASVFWAVKTKPSTADYAEFRRYLDAVFTWANSASLARRAERVGKPEELVPGDFFLHTKPPGHVAIVLDVAQKPSGERVALLAQALSPTESVHVIRPGRATPWFNLRPTQPIATRRSAAFEWNELCRLSPAKASNSTDSAPGANE